MPRPPGHGPNYETRRQQIIDDAAILFAKRGYAATGVTEIGEYVGLARGALYYYIGSKEDLLAEIQDRVLGPLLKIAAQVMALDIDSLVRVRLISKALMNNIMERLDHIWVYEHDYRQLTGESRRRVLRQRQEFEQVVLDALGAAREDGEVDVPDLDLGMLKFLNLHNHTYQWARAYPQWDSEFLSAQYTSMFLMGLGCSPARIEQLEADLKALRGRGGALGL